jgi:hypothetical protein
MVFFICVPTSVCEKNFRLFPSKIVKESLIKHRKIVYLKMQHVQGTQRHNLQMSSLEDKIASENPVRFVDAFLEYISQ